MCKSTQHYNVINLCTRQVNEMNMPWSNIKHSSPGGSSGPLPCGGSFEDPPQRGSLFSCIPWVPLLKPLELSLLRNGWDLWLGPSISGPWCEGESWPRPCAPPLLKPLELRSCGCLVRGSFMSNLCGSFLSPSRSLGCGRQDPWSCLGSLLGPGPTQRKNQKHSI